MPLLFPHPLSTLLAISFLLILALTLSDLTLSYSPVPFPPSFFLPLLAPAHVPQPTVPPLTFFDPMPMWFFLTPTPVPPPLCNSPPSTQCPLISCFPNPFFFSPSLTSHLFLLPPPPPSSPSSPPLPPHIPTPPPPLFPPLPLHALFVTSPGLVPPPPRASSFSDSVVHFSPFPSSLSHPTPPSSPPSILRRQPLILMATTSPLATHPTTSYVDIHLHGPTVCASITRSYPTVRAPAPTTGLQASISFALPGYRRQTLADATEPNPSEHMFPPPPFLLPSFSHRPFLPQLTVAHSPPPHPPSLHLLFFPFSSALSPHPHHTPPIIPSFTI